ncbi:cache domain-containing protein [Planctomycetota bacterium]
MKAKKLRIRILISFFTVIVAFALSVAVLGHYVIKRGIIERAQAKVKNDMDSAREIYLQEIERIRNVIRFAAVRFFIKDAISDEDRKTLRLELARIRQAESLDVLTLVDASGAVVVRSRNPSVGDDSQVNDELVSRILSNKEVVAGTFIVPRDELMKEGKGLAERAHTRFIPTPKAKPRVETEETSGMMIRAGAPVLGHDGRLLGVLYGGTLLNRNYQLVDRIKNTVYKGMKYKGKDIGTATIFQGDLRISTNVKAKDSSRAIGTRVSEEVYEHVVTKGWQWVDRAFVVSDWFKTAYEPIRDIDGRTVGILYVGTRCGWSVDSAFWNYCPWCEQSLV